MFDSKTVSKILGISLRQIQYWDEQGVVSPSAHQANGRGTLRLYLYEDLVQLKVVKRLRECNISLKKIKRSVEYLKATLPDIKHPLASFSFITNGETIFVLTDKEDVLVDTLRSGQITWHISMNNIVKEIKEIKDTEKKHRDNGISRAL